jgi:peptidoglycan L-alanyl-D-glutamate endopeptidase CwlK
MMFELSKRSTERLIGVHPDLIRVVKLALTLCDIDFTVIEGVRTIEKQREYVARGASKTMASRHLTGHAVDLYPVGKPTPWDRCQSISEAMFAAARMMSIPIRWGGDWDMDGDSKDEKFYDGPHFELLKEKYP